MRTSQQTLFHPCQKSGQETTGTQHQLINTLLPHQERTVGVAGAHERLALVESNLCVGSRDFLFYVLGQ